MALNCAGSKFVGSRVLLEFALACGDVDHETLSWLPLGGCRNKSVSRASDTIDVTSDDSEGNIRETLTTFKTFELSVDGITKLEDGTTTNQNLLSTHFDEEEQPYVWFRLTGPIKTTIAFCVLTTFDEEMPYDDAMTYSIAASATGRGAGLPSIITGLTPVPVTGVTVSPATATVEEGNTTNLIATVQPVSAVQAVTWESATPATATVSSSGVVTGVAAGVVVITATSVSDPTESDICTVTVTAP
jgi:predicted secreted protein